MTATDVLKRQHREVLRMFTAMERTEDPNERRRLLDDATDALRVHAQLEEDLFYPAIRAHAGEPGRRAVLEALEAHHALDLLLDEAPTLDPEADRFPAKMAVLRGLIVAHVEAEERDLFPLAVKLGTDEMHDLGRRLEAESASLS